jgi:regulator of protease activity HflC (stomatin/prohibitin superfamily)
MLKTWVKVVLAFLAVTVVAMVIGFLADCIHSVDPNENVVVYARIQRFLAQSAVDGGRITTIPASSLFIFPKAYIEIDFNTTSGTQLTCVSADGLSLSIDVSTFYKLPQDQLPELVQKFDTFPNIDTYIRGLVVQAVMDACSDFTVEADFIGRRQVVEAAMLAYFQSLLVEAGNFSTVTVLQLKNISPPTDLLTAISVKDATNGQIAVALNTRAQSLTNANTQLLQAEVDAQITVTTANANAIAIINVANQAANAETTYWQELGRALVIAKTSLGLNSTDFVNNYVSKLVLYQAHGRVFVSGNP